MAIISLDWETYYDTKLGYDIRKLGAYGYCHHPLFNPYLISVSDGSDSWAGSPKDFNWDALAGQTLLSHNEYFDGLVYSTMVERGLAPKIEFKEWLCTANMTSYLCNRRSLADSVEFLLGVRLEKTVRNEADGKTEAVLRSNEAGWKSMLDYGRSDALRCWQLFNKYGHLWPQHERELSRLTIEQGRRGVQIDVSKLDQYLIAATSLLQIAEQSLPWIKEGRPPTSPKAMAELCRKEGIPCPPIKSHAGGEEAFIDWEKTYSPKHAWIAGVSNWRSVNKFLGTLQTMKDRLLPDGVLPFALKYFGAHTGRWSGDAGLNMQNLRKEPLSDLDIRSLFIPRPGTKMIVCDLAQIEPRCLAWLTGDTALLERVATGHNIYQVHAELTMGWTGGDLKKEDKEKYLLAKIRCLALGYGAGWEKFIVIAAMYGLDLTKDDPEFLPCFTEDGDQIMNEDGNPKLKSGRGITSKAMIKAYREANPKIVVLWGKLDTAFKNSVGSDFQLELPSGRSLRYGSVRTEWRAMVDPDTGKAKRKQVFTALVGDRRTILYGGLLTENLVQACARDVFAYHLLQLEKMEGVKILWTVHDEVILECAENILPKDIEAVMSETPPWIRGCPVAAEAAEVPYYKK